MPTDVSIVAALTTIPKQPKVTFSAIPEAVEWLEVRGDLTGDIDPYWLRGWTNRKVIYRLRPRSPDGTPICSGEERNERLRRAGRHYDLVELQADRDLVNATLDAVPPHKRIISVAANSSKGCELARHLEDLTAVPARYYKFYIPIESSQEAVATMGYLKHVGRADVIVMALGPKGIWTRLIGCHLGAPLLFCRLESDGMLEDPDGEPTLGQMIEEYRLPRDAMPDELFGIVGGRAVSSLSPKVHNAGYAMLGRNAMFVPFPEPDYLDFWRALVGDGVSEDSGTACLGLPLRGLTVVSPHKVAGLDVLVSKSDIVERARSHNLATPGSRGWYGETTDPIGVMACLEYRRIEAGKLRVAIIGCGGAGRAIAVALNTLNARVTLFNRTAKRGRFAANLTGLTYVPLSRFTAGSFDLVVNATPVGLDGHESPFDLAQLDRQLMVIDLAYGVSPTPLAHAAKAAGISVCDGREVLWWQVSHQFRAMTGQMLPSAVREQVLGNQGSEWATDGDLYETKIVHATRA